MRSAMVRPANCPRRSAGILLERFAGDLAKVERYIVDEALEAALRADDYDGYLQWRRVKSACAELAADQRLEQAAAPATGLAVQPECQGPALGEAA